MRKYAIIDFSLCRPEECNGGKGLCPAVPSCKHKLLEQEDSGDAPVLFSTTMCVGCGDCAVACPFGAINIEGGY